MAHLQIDNAETFYRTFADLMAAGEDDKHLARKLGCSRGETKRRRLAFQKQGIVTDKGVSAETLDAWLASKEGQRSQTQWDAINRRQKTASVAGNAQQKGLSKQAEVKRGWSRQKV